jgi:hypothetical protein
MRWWLLAAGVYNIVWGSVVVVAPDFPFALANMPALAQPGRAIWQCLGMVLAAYGLGYIAASRAPLRHWPIVFVGLFGKVMGPIGFVWSAWQGTIAWKFGATILTNDLLWWIPFGLMLLAARRAWLASQR